MAEDSPEKPRDSREEAEGGAFSHPVVAVGASAGGIEALKNFCAALPADIHASFVILQHLAPDHDSQLADILERASSLPVKEAVQDMQVAPGEIYVLMPDRYLTVVDHGLFVEPPTEPRGQRMPIDHFMHSLAEAAQEMAVGVVLSGTGSDGTMGLRAIKGNGGFTLVQSPESAIYDGMPRAAIDAGVVDEVAEIPQLCSTIAELSSRIAEGERADGLSRDDLNSVVALIKARTGHDFSSYKAGTVSRRVLRRMNLLRIDNVPDYLEQLRTDSHELGQMFDDLLINVTSFFRDGALWDKIAEKALKPLASRAADRDNPVRIWVPACSTGEEAYTLAMIMDEICSRDGMPCDWQIFATDLDKHAIAKGREALYPAAISSVVSPERVGRYFDLENGGLRVKKRLREKVVFALQNVITDPPFSKLDLISCRNLLIYLDNNVQERLLETFHFALSEGGMLVLGTSETSGGRSRMFKTVDSKAHIFLRQPGRSTARLSVRSDAILRDGFQPVRSAPQRDPQSELGERVRKALLQRYAPAAIAVDRQGDILYFHGPVRRVLDQPEGAPSQNIFDMLPAPLRSRVREIISRADQKESTRQRSVTVRYPERDVQIRLDCEVLRRGQDDIFLLGFTEEEEQLAKETSQPRDDGDDYIRHLEQELAITREDLQTTVEELETSNEELKASHEEAVAANEELQSANEELETSREELQSLNEELVTVNNQLEEKVREVERSTDDMRNLLTSTRLPVLFLDPDLTISSFTPSMSEVVELRESDVGRPVVELAFKVEDANLFDDARRTLRDLGSSEREIQARDGRIFLRGIRPYRTSDERIDGVVVTYSDVTRQVQTSRRLAMREQQQRTVAELSQQALAAREVPAFLSQLCYALRDALDCDFVKVLRLDEEADVLQLVAGTGWNNDLVGTAGVPTGADSQGGYTLATDHAILVEDFEDEKRFAPPPLLSEHDVRSGISCKISVGGKNWGVLGLHDRDPRHFTSEDLVIAQAAANVASATITQIERELHLARESLTLSLAIKSARLGVWIFRREDEEIIWDERLRQIIGLGETTTPPSLSLYMDMVHPEDHDRVDRAFRATLEKGDPFYEEYRLIRPDGETIWISAQGQPVIEGGSSNVLGVVRDITKRKAEEEQNRFIMRELDHRVKNVLAIILSIAKITGKAAPNFEKFIEGFEQRLQAMARTHSLLAEARWQGASLRVLIEEELRLSRLGDNVAISGPEIALAPSAAQAISMALHELCTNALKYGALSVPDGKLTIRWSEATAAEGRRLLDFEWKERGGPEVEPPETKGFGSKVIERIMTSQLEAEPEVQYQPEGLVVRWALPLDRVTGGVPEDIPQGPDETAETDLTPIAGKRIAVVDDEWLVAEGYANALMAAGAEIVGPFHTLDEAEQAIGSQPLDFALLDYNLDGDLVDGLLVMLEDKGVPALIVSGYGSDLALGRKAKRIGFLAKPVRIATLLDKIAELLAGSEGQSGSGKD